TWKRVDDDFILEQWNDAAENTTQGIIKNLKGVRASELYSNQPEIISNIELCFSSRGTFSEERHYHTQTTNETKYLKVSYAFAPPDLVIIHVMDLTERKSAEEALKRSEEKYRILVENVRAAIGIMDADGRLLFTNQVGAEIMGIEINELVGKTQWDMFPEALAEEQVKTVKGVIETGKELQTEVKTFVRGEWRWFDVHIQPFLLSDFGKEAAMIIASDITDRKISDTRNKARMNLLNRLRDCETIDECLDTACEAIYEAGLFKRSVLTLHDTRKRICNLGYKGLDSKIINAARKAPPPSDEQTAWMTQEKFRIRNSFFIPEEAGMKSETVSRYIPAEEFSGSVKSPWKPKDELFVPIREDKNRIEGWLSVDTPFNHNRPTEDVIINLEEIVDIVGKKVHEIQSMQQLERERLALEEKNIALKEVLGHIEEEKVQIRQQIASNIDRILMPTLNKLIGNDTRINPSYLQILKNGLEELSNSTGGILHQYSKLSPREIEVCNLIKNGSTSKEIAGTLNITIETVNKHRRTIRKKLGISKKDINLVTFLNRI
ncbi:MAG: PAS domain S-box protein, partial [candidate division Zixibacteria bacterium]|nr:PAS domain S-box protein [candidate division Zixibacteria bacterium]